MQQTSPETEQVSTMLSCSLDSHVSLHAPFAGVHVSSTGASGTTHAAKQHVPSAASSVLPVHCCSPVHFMPFFWLHVCSFIFIEQHNAPAFGHE
jgi:hypothetical protein